MHAGADAVRPRTVLISYAWESDELREAVKRLAFWLREHDCIVICDHDHPYLAPVEGWTNWMFGSIQKADRVLVVCTPKLKVRYEKNEASDAGHGATFEGAIVTRSIYDNAMRNEKFCPILPDGGSTADIPFPLDDWFNGCCFPSGNERILRAISGDPVGAAAGGDEQQEEASEWNSDGGQGDLAAEKLARPSVAPFFRSMQAMFEREFGRKPPEASAAMVRFFSQYVLEKDEDFSLFNVVRDALGVSPADPRDPARREIEEAAAAMYLLACRQLVNRKQRGDDELVLHVPKSERLVSAIIATALFGGGIELKAADGSGRADCEHLFDVALGGDQPEADFERAAFIEVFRRDPEAPDLALEPGPLGEATSARLAARFRTFRRRKYCLALRVAGFVSLDDCRAFADKYKRDRVPVLVPESEATTELLGMTVKTLEAEIAEFWGELKVLRRRPSPPHDQTQATPR